jgi:hypothetical protein
MWAYFEWRAFVQRLCDEWWPARYYPNWLSHHIHPAARFMGACLLWRPELVLAEWVRSEGLDLNTTHWNPADIMDHLEAPRWRAAYEHAMRRLQDAVRDGTPLSPELLAEIDTEAKEAGGAASSQALSAALDPARSFRYVALPPGISSSDWRALEARVLEYTAERLGEQVRRLRDAGHTVSGIARILGISRRAVERRLS